MGQVCPKDSKELSSSLMLKNKIKPIDKEKMCQNNSDEENYKSVPRYLSPEKTRATATWIMTTW